MRPITERALDVLNDAEARMRKLVAEAASGGDYAAVVRITAWARSIRDLAGTSGSTMVQTEGNGATAPKSSVALRRQPVSTLTSKQSATTYPQFLRDGDEVVLIAWSKREKEEYRHKSSVDIVQTLSRAVAETGADGRVFTAEQLLPIRDSSGKDVPNYKSYVALSLLKHSGIIEQHGRRGYSIATREVMDDAVRKVLARLQAIGAERKKN